MSDTKQDKQGKSFTQADIDRAVMADSNRPCLFGVAGPCFHPKCLNAHYETIKQRIRVMYE